jgi:hypothetical protein
LFETIPLFEFRTPVPAEFFGGEPGTQQWRLVRRVFNKPNFMLVVSPKYSDLNETFFIADFQDVIAILSRDDITDHKLYVLLPNYLTKDGEPALYRMTQAFEGKYEGYDVGGYICANGKTFFDTPDLPSDAIITEKTILYGR